jgi:hypothetical protein
LAPRAWFVTVRDCANVSVVTLSAEAAIVTFRPAAAYASRLGTGATSAGPAA